VAVFEQFALLAKDRIGNFADQYHWEFSGGRFGR
jgi:hypothetical protein